MVRIRPAQMRVVVWPSGQRSLMPRYEAIRAVRSGDARELDPQEYDRLGVTPFAATVLPGVPVDRVFAIYMQPARGGALRGPSCAVQGVARGLDSRGLPRLSLVEKYAKRVVVRDSDGTVVVDYGQELDELGRIHHGVLLGLTV